MLTIALDGLEYILRCDLNVIEELTARFGDISEIDAGDIAKIKEAAAIMMNEHYYYIGSDETVTPRFVGSRLQVNEYRMICEAVFGEINDCIVPKN